MTQEQENLRSDPPLRPPVGLAWTVMVDHQQSADDFVAQFVEVWTVVASWGRWCDDTLGEWPDAPVALSQLPRWFADRLSAEHRVDIPGWLGDLHDRQWIVWSAAKAVDAIRIDLSTEAMPLSIWPIQLVIEIIGGRITFSGPLARTP